MSFTNIVSELSVASKNNFVDAQQFFKTGEGSYSANDVFIGVRKADQRLIAKKHFQTISKKDLEKLLTHKIHEYRSTALLILEFQYTFGLKKKQTIVCKEIYDFTLSYIGSINNWDLVDQAAPNIIGRHLFTQKNGIAQHRKWCNDKNMWIRRIGIVATWYYIRKDSLDLTYDLAPQLFFDEEDLMHKATGWMLREAGRRDMSRLDEFVRKHHAKMPRTMLRYAIEKFDEPEYSELLNLGK